MATASGAAQLWDPSTGRPIGAPIVPEDSAFVPQIEFNNDGTVLTNLTEDGSMRFWHTELWADPYQALCSEAGALSKQEWSQHAPGEPRPAICR